MSAEKALAVMIDDSERVLSARPHETFWSREIVPLPGPYSNVKALYCSLELERAIRSHWAEHSIAEPHRVKLLGLGDLSLTRAAKLHAVFR